MTDISADSFERLREEGEFLVSRGIREGDGLPVLLVAPCLELPLPAGLVPLQRVLTLGDNLDSSWAVRPLELVEIQGRPALLTDDPDGEFLDALIGRPLPVAEFLRLATGIAGALGGLHGRGLVHKDIKPANLMVKVETGEAWLAGFFLASRLPRHRQPSESPEIIDGTLAYMAPEQTGRMNRSIDSRSDLYSLGITFYEMLVGALPFTASDPMEWVHCHIARRPVAPGERVDGIPEPISAIVMKLLAKAPEERYQTAAGVEADLRHCRAAWEFRGQIEPFPLGAHDVPDHLLIPEKLFGREKEIELLLAAFDRVVKTGTTELVLVSGYSGIGKSSAVNELHKALVAPRALFASGKFDQYKRDIPYATLAQAFQKLVQQILTQSDAEVLRWRNALLEALGPNGRLIVNLIPEIELIIGDQPPVVELPPKDAQNRFQMVFRRALSVFARPEHPLALFLDDLQWLDAATLDLLQHLVTDDEVRHLLIIGAYRDNEVSLSHPLMRTLAEIGRAGAPVHQIALANLGLEDVTQLVADALHCTREHAYPLAQLVHVKTGGNPFFAIQFISALEEEGLLAFSPAAATWEWNIDHIRAKGFTENVVELMVAKLNRLSPATQNALKHLACLGNRAPTATLGLVHVSHVFTPPRIAVLQLLASQAAISLENARLYTEVQQAEERAKQREREFRLAVDMMPALAWKTLADGSIETFNKQWHDYTGISAEAALGGGWAASFHPDDRERVIETWRRNLACGGSSEIEARMRRFDGEYRWFLLRASPLLDESGNILKWYGTNSDIDDLKRAEGLLAGEKRLFEMIATGQTLPAILDALCRIVEELNGGSPTSILLLDREGKRLRNGGAPNLPESYTKAIDGIRIGPSAASCGTAAYRGEKVFVSDIATDPVWADYRALALEHDLRACWSTPILSAAGSVLGTIAVYSRQARPITPRENTIIEHFTHLASIGVERKRAEDALQKSEAFLAEGQRISHTGSWAWNLATDQVFWSEEHCRIFGYRPDEVGGNFASILDRMLPEDRLRVEVPIAEAVRMGRDYSVEYRIVLPDGSIKYNQTVGRAIANESGEVTEYIGTTVDITERKRAEEELRRTEAGLRKAQSELAHVTRVTTMGELAASIAHEVNQPIAGVVLNGNACLRWLARVKEDSVNLVEAREAVERIIRDGRRAGEVVSRIRALFKKAETTKTPLELNEVVREVVVLARSEMDRKRVTLRLKLAPELPRVPGDRVQLQQVLLNLILNGIEAMGTVQDRPRELELGTQVNVEGKVLVTVRDSGAGLDPEVLEQAFTAFHTTKPGGLGMGLSISRSIIENHAGRLWATTNDGPGMTFQFTLSTDLPNLVTIYHE